jgi:hypothetical protein
MIKGAGSAYSITADLDLVSNLFTIDHMIGVSSAKMNYFAIGVQPTNVCSPCNNYISISGCLDVCPNSSYPQNLTNGGKTCRFCNSNLGQTLNTLSTNCTCTNGQSYYKGNCYNLADLPTNCGNSQLLINNQCISTISNSLCPQSFSYYDTTSSSCLCIATY